MRSPPVSPVAVEGHSWELCSFVTVARDQRLILLTIHYTRLARSLKSDYCGRSTRIIKQIPRISQSAVLAEEVTDRTTNRRRTTAAGTSCPPFNTLSLTLDSATSTLFTHRKKMCTSYPCCLSWRTNLK